MTAAAHQKKKMEEKAENSGEASAAQENVAPADETTLSEDFSSELREPRWSVVTFEGCAASGQTYDEAVELMKKLEAEKASGLCIISDEAAERLSR